MKTQKENKTNLDKLDEFINKTIETLYKVHDISNSIKVTGTIITDDDSFQKTKVAVNALLGTNIKKIRGSNQILETTQEINLVPSNDEDSLLIEVIKDILSPCSRVDRLNKLSHETSRKLFSGEANSTSAYGSGKFASVHFFSLLFKHLHI